MYEAATSFGEVGAGLGMSPTPFLGVLARILIFGMQLGLWPRVWNILRTLGLEDKLLAVTMARPKDQLG